MKLSLPLKQKPYDERLEDAKRRKEQFDREAEIREINQSMRHWKPPTATKVIMAWLLINCTAVEVYAMVAMYRLMDLSALYALITAVVTESISFAVYAAKSYNETKQEEIIKLERSKLEIERERLSADNSPPASDEDADPENNSTEEDEDTE